ncbi:MAG: transglutaminase-like domain-containing protein [Chloroflexi bacterium]|nr:transglutaminase-like domain-containing protein [Chloroflexota bacterium]MCI0644980.1 transglutaminase-like domain-containing protein [Chloroflexota bacterium]MCI0727859.1 transglutaminase-like domain-containing protein [Chloroflexota bacterium]
MAVEVLVWVWNRFRPQEGWLTVFLWLAAVSCLVTAVVAVEWTPESFVVWTAVLGLLLGIVLAKRPVGWLPAWVLIVGYGLVMMAVHLGQLWPPFGPLLGGWDPSSAYIRQSWGLLVDRAAGWWRAVAGGGSSQETVVFTFGLGLLAWLLAAYAGWSTFRQHRPLAGLAVMGLALAINGYYGGAPLWPAAVFVGLAALLAAAVNFASVIQEWEARQVDYSEEIRLDLLLICSGIALVLLAISFILPTINFRALSRALLERPAIHQAEETLERAFAGVQQPRRELPGERPGGGPVNTGAMPRAYLLGNPPELYEIVVMTATVSSDLPASVHWRGISYDVYTGRGWAVSTERQETIAAGQAIPLPAVQEVAAITQSVAWLYGEGQTRYTLGLPVRFDQEVITIWRGLEDLSRVEGQGSRYQAVSQVSRATPAGLRQAQLDEAPAAIMARYTQLPDNLPERVYDLARQVAGEQPTPYEQARALERFLRQYPYSLDVALPPAGADPVDYFLFELQHGYCDYYASAMVVMARALGLPARLATGFLAQPAGENGVQTIYQINSHSWAEIYFAGYGWVEFEPTAAFPASDETAVLMPDETGLGELLPVSPPPPIPERPPAIGRWWPVVVLGLVGLLLAGWWRRRRRPAAAEALDGVLSAYGRLQRQAHGLGQPAAASQTPAEFEAGLLGRINALAGRSRLAQRLLVVPGAAARKPVIDVRREIERLTALFIARQYAGQPPAEEAAGESWRRLRGRLWLLNILKRVMRVERRAMSDEQ